MADTFKFQKDWYEAILNDKYVKTTPQEMAYIVYAAMQYAFNDGQPIDLGETFGEQFRGLNRSMPNIYDQINRIRNYEKNKNEEKYDNDAIYQLRMEGKTGKEICQILGYPLERERSLSSTKGWKRAREDKKKNTEICKTSVNSIEKIQIQNTESVQNNTENIQKDTESVQSVNTESVKNLQKSVNFTGFNF
jgi:hypothetical protein